MQVSTIDEDESSHPFASRGDINLFRIGDDEFLEPPHPPHNLFRGTRITFGAAWVKN